MRHFLLSPVPSSWTPAVLPSAAGEVGKGEVGDGEVGRLVPENWPDLSAAEAAGEARLLLPKIDHLEGLLLFAWAAAAAAASAAIAADTLLRPL